MSYYPKMKLFDLKILSPLGHTFAVSQKEMANESRQNNFGSTDGSCRTYEFHKCIERYHGNYKVNKFSCWNQCLCMAFAQLA